MALARCCGLAGLCDRAAFGAIDIAGDEGAASGLGAEVAGASQLGIGVDDADAADAELARE